MRPCCFGFLTPLNQEKGVGLLAGVIDPEHQEMIGYSYTVGGRNTISGTHGILWGHLLVVPHLAAQINRKLQQLKYRKYD